MADTVEQKNIECRSITRKVMKLGKDKEGILLEFTALACLDYPWMLDIPCWILGVQTLKFLYVDLTGFAGTSQFKLPLPVYLAGKEDWRAKGTSLSLPILFTNGINPLGSLFYFETISNGMEIPTVSYSDQPFVVKTDEVL